MKNHKRWFQGFILVTVVWFSSFGCMTKGLWESGGSVRGSYHDEIVSFYISPKNSTVIFMSDKYHYILNQNTDNFIEILKNREFINLQQENLTIYPTLHIDEKNRINVNIYISFNEKKITENQRVFLIKHGFTRGYDMKELQAQIGQKVPRSSNTILYMNNYTTNGTRYLANREVNSRAYKLKQPLFLKFDTHKKEGTVTAEKILMTPLAVVADAGLVLAGVIVLPIVWLFK